MLKNEIDSVQPQNEKLYGIYRGVVEDNSSDPLKAGRCKIRVWGVHTDLKLKSNTEGIPTDELPWASPALSLFEGGISGNGAFEIPLQGSHVFLFFENGHILKPVYFASAPGVSTEEPNVNRGFSDPDGNYPTADYLNESDYNRLARNENIDQTIVQTKTDNKTTGVSTASGSTWDEPDPYYNAEYPNNKVFSTSSGITIEIDDTEGAERVHIYHPSNSYVEIDKDGNMVIKNKSDKFEIVSGDHKVYVEGGKSESVDGDKETNVGGDMVITIEGNKEETIQGNTLSTSIGTLVINGATVTLNADKGDVNKIVTAGPTGHICAFTGYPHLDGSSTCFAHK